MREKRDVMRIILGITGASGAVYGLELLRQLSGMGHEVHVVVSEYGWKVLEHECQVDRQVIDKLSTALYPVEDITAPIASGSFRADMMVVAPCTMRTLAAVATGLADNLLCRAADVCMKERKPLTLLVRETPFSPIHLENMLKLSRIGVSIVPASPGFYHQPRTLEDLVAIMVGRVLDTMGIENNCFKRWAGMPEKSKK